MTNNKLPETWLSNWMPARTPFREKWLHPRFLVMMNFRLQDSDESRRKISDGRNQCFVKNVPIFFIQCSRKRSLWQCSIGRSSWRDINTIEIDCNKRIVPGKEPVEGLPWLYSGVGLKKSNYRQELREEKLLPRLPLLLICVVSFSRMFEFFWRSVERRWERGGFRIQRQARFKQLQSWPAAPDITIGK